MGGVLVSYCCCNKLPRLRVLKQHRFTMSQFCRSEGWVGSVERKLLAELCSFLETPGGRIRFQTHTGRWQHWAPRGRRQSSGTVCWLDGAPLSSLPLPRPAAANTASATRALSPSDFSLPLPHLSASCWRRFSLLMSSDGVHPAGLPLLMYFGQVLGLREWTPLVGVMLCLPQME